MTDPDVFRLSERQHLAIDVLLIGGTHDVAAETAGVCRTTVTGWVNHHIQFITELERRRQERSAHLSDLMGEALVKAVEVVTTRLNDCDLAAAVALLRLVDSSVLYRRPLSRPVTAMSTTTRLAEQLDSEAMVQTLLPSRAVFAVEDLSAAHCSD